LFGFAVLERYGQFLVDHACRMCILIKIRRYKLIAERRRCDFVFLSVFSCLAERTHHGLRSVLSHIAPAPQVDTCINWSLRAGFVWSYTLLCAVCQEFWTKTSPWCTIGSCGRMPFVYSSDIFSLTPKFVSHSYLLMRQYMVTSRVPCINLN